MGQNLLKRARIKKINELFWGDALYLTDSPIIKK
jgi:hypothetical protein